MADYSFFMMGAFAVVAAAIVGTFCILLAMACIITARKVKAPSAGLIGFILALGSMLTCGLTALPGLVFAFVGIRQKAYPRLSWAAAVVSAFVILLCVAAMLLFFSQPTGTASEIVAVSAATLAPYRAIFEVDRLAMGFPPLPTNGMVKIETVDRANWRYEYPPPNYDVMLAFYNDPQGYRRTERSIALKKAGADYQWVHEQMLFTGPKTYTNMDGTFNERIVITCEKEQVAFHGSDLQGTAISYSGTDPRLAGATPNAKNLTVAEIAPILREWGYTYDEDSAQLEP